MVTISNQKTVGKRELFSVEVAGVTVHDCSIAEGKNGPFVSGPSRSYIDKNKETKWVNLAMFSREVQHEVMDALRGAKVPEIDVAKEGFADDDVPF